MARRTWRSVKGGAATGRATSSEAIRPNASALPSPPDWSSRCRRRMKFLGRFPAVGDDLLDHSPGHAGREGGGGHQAIHQFVPFPSGHDPHHASISSPNATDLPDYGQKVVKGGLGPYAGLTSGSSRTPDGSRSVPTHRARRAPIASPGTVRSPFDAKRQPSVSTVTVTPEPDG